MRIPYLPVRMAQPVPSLRGALVRYPPIAAIRLAGAAGTRLRDGLLDSGSDDTVLSEALANDLGVDLSQGEVRLVQLAGRLQPLRCVYAPVDLQITDGMQETYEWTAVVGFVAGRLHYNLFGHAGFLEFFDADFRGNDREVLLKPNQSFPGRSI